MNVATQRSGTDLAYPTQRFFRIYGTEKDKSIAAQRLQAESILPWQRIHRQAAT
jgi:hypothetical protein